MRTTDPDPSPWRPLGEKVQPTKPAEPEWKSRPDAPHIEENKDGHMRTKLPLPPIV